MFYTNFFSRGKTVYVKGYNDDESHLLEKYDLPLTFYSKKGTKPTQYKTLNGAPLFEYEFDSLQQARAFGNDLDGEMYGNLKSEYTLINDLCPGDLKPNLFLIRVGYLDIETTCDDGFPEVENPRESVNCVTVVFRGKSYTLTTKPVDPIDGAVINVCADEVELFNELRTLINKLNLDVISGWYVELFDIPYLVARSRVLFGDMRWAKAISPWGIVHEQELTARGKTNMTYEFAGITTLDYKDVYTHYGKKQPNYSLDAVSQDELGDQKLKYAGSFKEFYTNDYQLFVEYNIKDSMLVYRLEEKLHYMSLIFMLAYKTKTKYRDTFMQIRMWEMMIYNELLKTNVIAHSKLKTADKDSKFEGAFVADPIPGLYEWVVTFDAKGLYPSLMRTLNISPETYIENVDMSVERMLKGNIDASTMIANNVSMAANGALFSREHKGFIPMILEKFSNERDVTKGRMLSVERKLNLIDQIQNKRKAS